MNWKEFFSWVEKRFSWFEKSPEKIQEIRKFLDPKVKHFRRGWGEIIDIEKKSSIFLLKIKFDFDGEFLFSPYILDSDFSPPFIKENFWKENSKTVAKNRNIKFLVHFSPFPNLESILKFGILSRKKMEKREIKYIPVDPLRLDNFLNFISVSISFPNYKMFFRVRQEKKISWVILRLDPAVLWELNSKFFISNASARRVGNLVEDLEELFGNACFNENPNFQGSAAISREDLGIPDCFTTDPQAEVMVEGEIPREYIKGIITENWEMEEKAREISMDFLKKIEIETQPSFFGPRMDFKFWSQRSIDQII